MISSELRIGNLCKDQAGNLLEVVGLESNRVHFIPPLVGGKKAEFIPLTKERLKTFGFEIVRDRSFRLKIKTHHELDVDYYPEGDRIAIWPMSAKDVGGAVYINNVKYVHHLQNILFALTGKEPEYLNLKV